MADSGFVLGHELHHGDLDEQAKPMPAVLGQDGGDLLEPPVRCVGLGADLGQCCDPVGRVVPGGDGIVRQSMLDHGLL